jgi:hypothetical protein
VNEISPDSNQPAPDIRNSRSLGSKANTPEPNEHMERSGDGDDQMVISANADGKMVISKGTDRTSANHSESDYQRIREANIAQNKKILRELGFLGDKTDEDGKKVKKGTNDRKNEAETGTR